jgi:hypothetical protein
VLTGLPAASVRPVSEPSRLLGTYFRSCKISTRVTHEKRDQVNWKVYVP